MSPLRVLIPLGVVLLAFSMSLTAEPPGKEPPVKAQPRQFSHDGAVSSAALSPDGKLLATCAADKRVHLWDLEAGKELGPFPALKDIILALAFAPDGKTLVSAGADKTIRFWQVDPVKQLQQADVKDGALEAVAFSPDGKLVATGGADRMIRIWDVGKAKELRVLKGHQGIVTSVAFSPNGKELVSGSKDRTVRLWDVETGTELSRYREHRGWVHAVAFAPDGQSVASAGQDQTVVLWDVIADRLLLRLESYDGSYLSVAFSPDGRVLAAGSKDRKLHFWDLATGEALAAAGGNKGAVLSLAFSKSGKILASGAEDGTAMIWDAADLPRRETPKGELSARDLEHSWNDLAGDHPLKAYRALQTLVAHPKQSTEFLGTRLKSVAEVDLARVKKLVTDLDNDEFAVREKATEELLAGGELMEKALRKIAKEQTLPLEGKRRLEQILDTMANRPMNDERRRRHTAFEVMERIGTPEAKQALKSFAEGASEAAATQEAKAALERLVKRAAAKPKPDE